CEVCDPVWLAKAHRDEYFVDFITGMSNAALTVTDSWITRARPAVILGLPTRILAPEELLASKLFVVRRERFDGADIAHIIYATADLHYSAQTLGILKEQFGRVRDEADVLVVAGDLTNFGRPEEMEPLLSVLVRLRIPTIAVLGNHDYECGKEAELIRMLTSEGIKVLDGTGYERDGVGFA